MLVASCACRDTCCLQVKHLDGVVTKLQGDVASLSALELQVATAKQSAASTSAADSQALTDLRIRIDTIDQSLAGMQTLAKRAPLLILCSNWSACSASEEASTSVVMCICHCVNRLLLGAAIAIADRRVLMPWAISGLSLHDQLTSLGQTIRCSYLACPMLQGRMLLEWPQCHCCVHIRASC